MSTLPSPVLLYFLEPHNQVCAFPTLRKVIYHLTTKVRDPSSNMNLFYTVPTVNTSSSFHRLYTITLIWFPYHLSRDFSSLQPSVWTDQKHNPWSWFFTDTGADLACSQSVMWWCRLDPESSALGDSIKHTFRGWLTAAHESQKKCVKQCSQSTRSQTQTLAWVSPFVSSLTVPFNEWFKSQVLTISLIHNQFFLDSCECHAPNRSSISLHVYCHL